MLLRFHIAFVLLTISNVGAAQLTFEKIEGLSQNTGYSIMKDRDGFIWIATADGLNRYDGVEIRVYKPGMTGSSGEMKGRIIRSELHEDNNGAIWFSTEESVQSLNKQTGTFTAWPFRDSTGKVRSLFANPFSLDQNCIWFANPSEGLFRLDLGKNETQHYPLALRDENGNLIQLMYNGVRDRNNNCWFATNKGLLQFNATNHRWKRYFSKNVFYSISLLNDTLYISEGKDLLISPAVIDENDPKFTYAVFEQKERDLIHRVYTDNASTIWIGDESGNIQYKTKGSNIFKWAGNVNHSGNVRTNYPVYSFYSDPSGVLWTGTFMLGLVRADIHRNDFHVFPKSSPGELPESIFVNTFYETADDEVWLGTFQKGIIKLNKKAGKLTPIELPYKGPSVVYGKSVHMIHRDSKGNLWTGSSGYIYVKEKGSAVFKSIRIPTSSTTLQNAQAWCIDEYNGGWVVGTNVGLYSVSKDDEGYIMKQFEPFSQNRIVFLSRSPSNDLWIAAESGGVVVTKDPADRTNSRKLFTGTNVKGVTYDNDHQLAWICSSNGLIAYHEPSGKNRIFTEKDGLTNTYTYAALRNGSDLWVSSNGGIFRVTVTFKENDVLPEASFVNFNRKDGLPDNQFNAGAAHKGKSGDLYFGSTSGITWFDPSQIESNSYLPKLVMTNISVNGRPIVDTLSSLRLKYTENNLFFRFRGIEYSNPSKVEYMYKLEGWDDDWIRSGELNEARYTNLSPGHYSFFVKSANSSGTWSNQTHKVVLTIEPPFWKTWWFYGLVLICTITLIVIIIRRMSYVRLQKHLAAMERQQELDKERQRISREMHDDIGAGLTQITLISEFVKNQNKETSIKELNDIATTSRQLVSNMGEIIWSLNHENPTLGHLLSYLREQLNRQLEYSGIEFTIHFPDDGSTLKVSNVTRRNVLLATREIVNNAIKHSDATKIDVSAELKDNILLFRISDNGIGFDSEVVYTGNGLKNVRERITILGGQLKIRSNAGAGTVFEYSITPG